MLRSLIDPDNEPAYVAALLMLIGGGLVVLSTVLAIEADKKRGELQSELQAHHINQALAIAAESPYQRKKEKAK